MSSIAFRAMAAIMRVRGCFRDKKGEVERAGVEAGIPNDTVDVVLLFNVLPMIEDRAAVMRELHRVLKPGGTLAVKNGRGSQLAGREELGVEATKALVAAGGVFRLKQELGKLQIFERL